MPARTFVKLKTDVCRPKTISTRGQTGTLRLLVRLASAGHNGISDATFYKWKSKYGSPDVSDVRRLRELEAENAKLKRMYADLSLENDMLKGYNPVVIVTKSLRLSSNRIGETKEFRPAKRPGGGIEMRKALFITLDPKSRLILRHNQSVALRPRTGWRDSRTNDSHRSRKIIRYGFIITSFRLTN
jgi:putative transposase